MPHVSPVPSSEACGSAAAQTKTDCRQDHLVTEIGAQTGPKTSTREVIKNASSPAIFEMCALL